MAVKWDSRFSVGIDIIDAEHKLLLATINAIEVALRHPENMEPLLFFIDQLYTFSIEHFRREEAMQLKHLFLFREENAKGHAFLIHKLDAIRNDVRAISEKAELSNEDMSLLHGHISYLAKDWLITHLLKEDSKMKGWLNE